MLPASWITQISLVTPASLSFSPAPWPATSSDWPTCVIAPYSLDLSAPELIVMTGMFAATALAIDSLSASGLAIETTRPSTFSLTAWSMSWDCFAGSPSLW